MTVISQMAHNIGWVDGGLVDGKDGQVEGGRRGGRVGEGWGEWWMWVSSRRQVISSIRTQTAVLCLQ